MPENYGVPEAGFDNFQVHNRALTSQEIKSAADGNIISKGLLIGYDFNDGVVDGQIKDLSSYGHHANLFNITPIQLARYELANP